MITGHYRFTKRTDGNMRGQTAIGLAPQSVARDFASVDQVHGRAVAVVHAAGPAGTADAIVTTQRDLPVAVFTADCLGVVLIGATAVGVAHAGWRGLTAGVIEATLEVMDEVGSPAIRGVIGPAIRSCCFEVGQEVSVAFPNARSTTTWGTPSVDLAADAVARLGWAGVESAIEGGCTKCSGDYYSYRNGDVDDRMAAVAWRP